MPHIIEGSLVGCFHLDTTSTQKVTAFVLAGGLGTRLGELTENCPKPMIEISGKPILLHIVENLKKNGIYDIMISVSYMKEKIIQYFGDGSSFGVAIRYIEENRILGTAGSLSLVDKNVVEETILVVNGDVMTDCEYDGMISYHSYNKSQLTVAAKNYTVEIPYGVVTLENDQIISLVEKPKIQNLINAGIYVLNSEVIDLIPYNQFFNMTDVVEKCLNEQMRVCPFLITNRWIDVGVPDELTRARKTFKVQ